MNESTPSRPRAVLWDMDGTLIDTANLHWLAWQAELASRGFDLSWETFLAAFGQRNDTTLRRWIRPDLPLDEINAISESKEARYRELIHSQGLDLLPGVASCLKTLPAYGWRQALATMTGRKNVETIFSVLGIGPYFDAVVAADEVQNGKPAPDVFLRAAERLGVEPARCIVIEDSPAGIEAARRAGMCSIGVNATVLLDADVPVASLLDLSADTFDGLVFP